MTTLTSRNVPMVESTDSADIAARVNPVAQLAHDRPGVATLTTTQRNALTGNELWHGRVIYNSTSDRLQHYQSGTSTWSDIADATDAVSLLATTGSPAGPGVAARGVSTSAARSDHVHPLQDLTPILATSGLPLTPGAANRGASAVAARSDHVHPLQDLTPLLVTTGTPAAAGTATRGVSTSAARADHVHPEQGVFVDYTATRSGFTASTIISRWCRIGDHITVEYDATLNAAVTGTIRVGLPVAARGLPIGSAVASDGNFSRPAAVVSDTATTVIFAVSAGNAFWGATVPFAWASGHSFQFSLVYQRA